MIGPMVDDEKAASLRKRWRKIISFLTFILVGGGGCWFGKTELQHLFGLEPKGATQLAVIPAGIAWWLSVMLITRLTIGKEPKATPRVRWLLFKKALASDRRWRPVMIFLTIMTALPFLFELTSPYAGGSGSADWSLANLIVPCFSLLEPTTKKGIPYDEGLHAEKGDAIRLGYIVILVLAVIASIANGYWPNGVARSWPLIIIIGVLTSQIRLVILDQRVTGEDDEAR